MVNTMMPLSTVLIRRSRLLVNGISSLNPRQKRILTREYRAIVQLIDRSPSVLQGLRCHVACTYENPSMNPHASVIRWFQTSASSLQKRPDSKGEQSNGKESSDGKDDDDDESKKSMLMKAAIWMLSAFFLNILISLLFPSTNQPDVLRYVSWNEFYYQMLSKGEVEKIIVRPDLNFAIIFLYPGAVIKGRRTVHRTYHMNIVNIDSFEKKLREAERRLGIRPEDQVTIVYERRQESTWLLLFSLVAVALTMMVMFRSGQIKLQSPTDMFVSVNNFYIQILLSVFIDVHR